MKQQTNETKEKKTYVKPEVLTYDETEIMKDARVFLDSYAKYYVSGITS